MAFVGKGVWLSVFPRRMKELTAAMDSSIPQAMPGLKPGFVSEPTVRRYIGHQWDAVA